jgi:hypothetical protein
MNRIYIAIACAVFSFQMFGQDRPAQTITIPRPSGLYVMDDVSNMRPANAVYAQGLMTSPAYLNDITGHAIFVPIAKILPSIELETGFQISTTYVDALPSGFHNLAGIGCRVSGYQFNGRERI